MENYTNKQLVDIYNACKTTENNLFQGESNYLLNEYNMVFGTDLGHLHYHMVLELYEKIQAEMALRFSKIDFK